MLKEAIAINAIVPSPDIKDRLKRSVERPLNNALRNLGEGETLPEPEIATTGSDGGTVEERLFTLG